MKALAVIPARYASTRFPGKPLLKDTDKYLIQHVYERVARAKSISRVIVATDDRRILQAVESFGGIAAMTRADHPSGTDRVAEAAAGSDADVIVNVQGDEPEIAPADIDRLVGLLADQPDAPMGTLACPFPAEGDPADPNAVKVVIDSRGRALYFSRALIPFPRDSAGCALVTSGAAGEQPAAGGSPPIWLLHIGIYAYRRPFLLTLATLPPTPLERIEKLEQLRVLEHGHHIAVALVERAAVGIDTPEDYAAFVRRMRAK